MKNFFCGFFLLPAFLLNAQVSKDAQRYASVIQPSLMREHLKVLTSDSLQGRRTASTGELRSRLYLEKQFREMGMKVMVQPFPVYRDSTIDVGLNINGTEYIRGEDFGVFTEGSHACDLKFSEVVFAGYGISTTKYDDYKNLDVAGRIVVVYGGEPKHDSIYLLTGKKTLSRWTYPPAKAEAATKHGAAALIIIDKEFPEKNFPDKILYNKIQPGLTQTPFVFYERANTFFISEKLAAVLLGTHFGQIQQSFAADTLPRIDMVKAEISLRYSRASVQYVAHNVFGILEGETKKDEYVVVSAHYDHLGMEQGKIFYGADDNGSGTAAVLAAAKAFAKAKQEGKGVDRSLVFFLTSGEENGLWGSDYYVQHPLFPLEKTSANINIDMIGRVDMDYEKKKTKANYVYVLGDNKLSTDMRGLVERNNSKTKLLLDSAYNNLEKSGYYFYRSDQYHFARMQVPVLFFTDGENEDYHKPSDTMEKLDYELMNRRVQLVFYVTWDIATRNEMLKRDIPFKD